MIPRHTYEQIQSYLHDRQPPSTFLRAVLTNDLFRAVGHADGYNLAAFVEIVKYVYNTLPVDAYGSEEAVKEWCGR